MALVLRPLRKVLRVFTREAMLKWGPDYVDTILYLHIGARVRLSPGTAPQHVDASGWYWVHVSSYDSIPVDAAGGTRGGMVLQSIQSSGWIHPGILHPE